MDMADLQSELEFKFKDYTNIRRKVLKYPVFRKFLLKMTKEQADLIEDALDDDVKLIFVNAKSGTGKTMMAVLVAYALYLDSRSPKEMLYVAAPVQENALGFTSGSIMQKEAKYMLPLYDALLELDMIPEQVVRNEEDPESQKESDVWCNAKTQAYVRGTNIINKTVIIDEAQNNTRGELKKVLTRLHDSSKTFVIGHDGQNDLRGSKQSGFVPYINHFKNEPYVRVHDLNYNFRGEVAQKADELEW